MTVLWTAEFRLVMLDINDINVNSLVTQNGRRLFQVFTMTMIEEEGVGASISSHRI